MATKYRLSRFESKIEAVEVVKETEKTYTVQRKSWQGKYVQERVMRSSCPLYDTWDDAQAALVDRCQKVVDTYAGALARSKVDLEAAKALNPFA